MMARKEEKETPTRRSDEPAPVPVRFDDWAAI